MHPFFLLQWTAQGRHHQHTGNISKRKREIYAYDWDTVFPQQIQQLSHSFCTTLCGMVLISIPMKVLSALFVLLTMLKLWLILMQLSLTDTAAKEGFRSENWSAEVWKFCLYVFVLNKLQYVIKNIYLVNKEVHTTHQISDKIQEKTTVKTNAGL